MFTRHYVNLSGLLTYLRCRLLSFLVMLYSLAAFSITFIMIVREAGFSFEMEMLSFITLSTLLAFLSFLIEDLTVFLTIHTFKGILLLIVIYLMGGKSDLLQVLLLISYLVETVIYLPFRPALITAVLYTGNFIFLVSFILRDGRYDFSEGIQTMALLLISLVVTGVSASLIRYRETIVGKNKMIKSLGISVKSLESANTSFLDYAERIENESSLNERNRVTLEIHDTIGYALTNIDMSLQAAKVIARKTPELLDRHLEIIRGQANSALKESRQILYHLRDFKNDKQEGLKSIYNLVKSFREATGINVELEFGNVPLYFNPKVENTVFRFVQEGLTNAIKHGLANEIRILFWLTDIDLIINVWDNGKGATNPKPGIGIAGMMTRFDNLGGRIEMEKTDYGFILRAYLPKGNLHYERK